MPTEQSAPPAVAQYEFGPFRLDVARRALYREDEFVPLTPKAAEILLLLIEDAGRVVTKEQLLARVWPGVVVEEGGIANNISALRKALDPGFEESPIGTVARRGYRFTAAVRSASANGAPAVKPASNANRNTILVGDIENRTGDAVFDGTIQEALVLHLAQSPFLEILTNRRVHSLLGYMGKPGVPVVGEVALEICQRSGCTAAIAGSIFALGDEYVIGLQALDAKNGDILVTEQSRARGKGEVLKALDQAAIGLRTKLGESLASVKRFSLPFDEVATASLEALKAYTIGRSEWLEHGEAAGKPHHLRAIELDPHFASAFSALALMCNNMGQTTDGTRYMQKAYELRDRASERERTRITAAYHEVAGDIFRGIDAHRAWESTYPRDASAATNLGNLYSMVGHWEKALAANLRGLELEGTIVGASNVAIAQMALGRHDEARATLEEASARGFDVFYLHLDAYHEAFLRGDEAEMQRRVDAVAGRDSEEDYLIAAQADTEAFHGRHPRARELSRRAVESARRAGSLEMAALWEAEAALREAEIGELESARAGARAALEMSTGRLVKAIAGLALARGGETDRVQGLMSEIEGDYPQHTQLQRYWLPCMRAALALGKKDWKAAIDALEPAAPVELMLCSPFEGGFMYPAYLRGLAYQGAGRNDDAKREFMKIVERPGLVKNFILYPLASQKLVSET